MAWVRFGGLAGVLGLGAGVLWFVLGAIPGADRHNARFVAGLSAAATLVVTWLTATFLAVVYAAYYLGDDSAGQWIPIMLLVATNVGGLIAVFRSAQTRSETGAALREVSELRISVLSAPVIEEASRARRAQTFEELTESLGCMLQLAVGLSLLPRAVDQASLWALDEHAGEWFICAATTPAREQQFRQAVVSAPAPEGGIVANLAAGNPLPALERTSRIGDVYLVGGGLRAHPWYMRNPDRDRPAEGMAVVLLRRNGSAFGALCFTWATPVVPTEGGVANEMIDILQRWAQAFGVGLERLYHLEAQLREQP